MRNKRHALIIAIVLMITIISGSFSIWAAPEASAAGTAASTATGTATSTAAASSTADSSAATDPALQESRAMAATGQTFRQESVKLNLTEDYEAVKNGSDSYTLMVYMVGSNLESRSGAGTKDIYEMLDAEIDPEKVNLLIYTGGSRRWFYGIPSDRNLILKVNGAEGTTVIAETDGNADMGEAATLTEFLNFCNTYYPAEHNALVLWDHGGGPLLGFGSDELFRNDSLSYSEMETAMNASPFKKEHKLDWVGFDACLMGTIECMKLWSSYADYYVGSEENEPGPGWFYEVLSVLNETTDPLEITSAIVDGYQFFYEDRYGLDYMPNLTLSVADLSKITQVSKALGNLSKKLKSAAAGSKYSLIQQIRVDTKAFGLSDSDEENDTSSADLVDMRDLTERLQEEYPGKTAKLLTALDELVVKSYTNVEHAGGVSFYYPYRNKTLYNLVHVMIEKTSIVKEYLEFVQTIAKKWLKPVARDWDVSLKDEDSDLYEYQLTEDQLKNTAAVYYTVLAEGDSLDYWPLLAKVRVYPDENGIVRIPKDPQVVCLRTETGEADPWPLVQMESLDTTETYRTVSTSLNTDSNTMVYDSLTSWDSERNSCTISLSSEALSEERAAGTALTIANVAETGDTGGGKTTLDISHYSCISFVRRVRYPATDSKGRTRPYSDWPDTGETVIQYTELKDQPEFIWQACSSVTDEAAIQLLLEDTNGELYASAIQEVIPSEDSTSAIKTKKSRTKRGEYLFYIYEDHAELYSYSGNDTELVIPDKISSKPVTVICCSAFYGNRSLTKVTVPEGVTTIEDDAFHRTSIVNISLPSTLKKIGINAFSYSTKLETIDIPASLESAGAGLLSGCSSLTSITMDGQTDAIAPGCKLVDGVLFSGDGSVLTAYPCGKTGEYSLPEDTKEIGYGAFANAVIEKVTLPEGLTRVGISAFSGCKNLEVPTLPDSLEILEAHAFGAVTESLVFSNEATEQTVIRIGSKLSYFGQGALDLFTSRRFEVSGENASFSSREGHLCNPAGDAIVAFALDGTARIRVPEGIVSLNGDQFRFLWGAVLYSSDWNREVDVEIPASVLQFDGRWSNSPGERIFHVAEQSEAEFFAVQNGINYNYCMDPASEEYRSKIIIEELEEPVIEKDGFTYDEDGKILISAPADIEEAVIPKGTEEIAEKAFYNCSKLKKVTIPEGVKVIGNYAFRGCKSLEEMNIPESLEEIGYSVWTSTGRKSKVTGGILKLGAAFAKADVETFDGLAFDAFEVDPANEKYSSVNGMLCDRSGTILLKAPSNTVGTVEIPDGIVIIREHAVTTAVVPLSSYEPQETITDVVVPESVRFIKSNAIPKDYDKGYLVTLHVKADSYAESFAIQRDVPMEIMQ